jgi:hypothetical protein
MLQGLNRPGVRYQDGVELLPKEDEHGADARWVTTRAVDVKACDVLNA